MKKLTMAALGIWVILLAWGFFFFSNQGHCDDLNCKKSDFTQWTWIIQEYSEENLQAAFDRNDRVGLYFKANWCGNCKVLEEDLVQKGIPAGSTVLSVDFDQAFELRKQYAVNNLHTLVVIGKDMNMIHKDSSGEYDTIIGLLQ